MESQYNSLVNTFTAPDLWNLIMSTKCSPPGDLVIPAAEFAPSYFFYRFGNQLTSGWATLRSGGDQPRFKSIGMYSNLGDCLVDISTDHQNLRGISGRFQLERFAAPITGTISQATAGSATITGSGTAFTRELVPGQIIMWDDDGGVTRMGIISDIASDTSMTITNNTTDFPGGGSGGLESTGMWTNVSTTRQLHPKIMNAGTDFRFQFPTLNTLWPYNIFCGDTSQIFFPRGLISVSPGSHIVTGYLTKFLTDLRVNQHVAWISDNGTRFTRRIATIDSDTQFTTFDPTGSGGPATLQTTRVILNRIAGAAPENEYERFLRLRGSVPLQITMSTIKVDTAFASKRLWFGFVAELENSQELTGTHQGLI